jgi:dTDP-L-rhamnose 4-epimerase
LPDNFISIDFAWKFSRFIKMASTRILITGGAGFIGSRLARELQRDGGHVVVLDNLLPQVHGSNPQPDLPECETIWADVRDRDALDRAMKGVEIVHHFAAETGVGQSQYEIARYVSVNTYGTALVLEAAAEAGVRQVVIASSRAVYGEGTFACARCGQSFAAAGRSSQLMDAGRFDIYCPQCGAAAQPSLMSESTPANPISIYGLTKYQQEQLAQQVSAINDLETTILRFFNVYGPGQSLKNPYVGVLGTFFRRASADETIEVYEDGQMSRDFVFVGDVVEALHLATNNEAAFGQIMNVGSGEALTLFEVASQMFRALGKEPQIKVSGRYRSGDIRHAVAAISRLEQQLGFVPRTSFADGLQSFVDWARENQVDTADDLAAQELASRHLLRQAALTEKSVLE